MEKRWERETEKCWRGVKKIESLGNGSKRERERKVKRESWCLSSRCDRRLYQEVREESAVKKDVYHCSFVSTQRGRSTFVQNGVY